MIAFIDDHRAEYGVEPICKVLPIAPSIRRRLRAMRDLCRAFGCSRSVSCQSDRVPPGTPMLAGRRSTGLGSELRGLWSAQGLAPCGGRASDVARCTVERSDAKAWNTGRNTWKSLRRHESRTRHYRAQAGQGEPAVQSRRTEYALGQRLHLRVDLAGVRLCGIRDRHLRQSHRRLACVPITADPVRPPSRDCLQSPVRAMDALEQALYERRRPD